MQPTAEGKPRRRYTDEERRAAVLAAATEGIRPAARRLGIPPQTLRQWCQRRRHPRVAEYIQEHKGQLADAFEQAAWECLALVQDKITDAPLKHIMTGVGIAVDKALLLRGQPTAIGANLNANANLAARLDVSRLSPEDRETLRALLAKATRPRTVVNPTAPDDGEDAEQPNVFAGTILDPNG